VECGAGPQVCALCNITTTSAEHMALHLRGKAHLRKQKIAEIQARQVRVPTLQRTMPLALEMT
jgi:hypothetical protein